MLIAVTCSAEAFKLRNYLNKRFNIQVLIGHQGIPSLICLQALTLMTVSVKPSLRYPLLYNLVTFPEMSPGWVTHGLLPV